jgi:hypothetical protein
MDKIRRNNSERLRGADDEANKKLWLAAAENSVRTTGNG